MEKEKILKELEKRSLTFEEILKMNFIIGSNSGKKLNKILRELTFEDKIYFQKRSGKYFKKNEETVIGIYKSTRHDFGFVENDNTSVFIPGKFIQNTFEGDTVKVSLFPLREDDNPEKRAGRIVRIMKRNGNNIIVRAKLDDENNINLVPDDFVLKTEVIYLGIENYNIENKDIFKVKFKDFVNKKIHFEVLEKIGNEENASLDFNVLALKNNIAISISDEIVQEVEKIKNKKEKSKSRKNLNDELIVTIDGISSKDLDDAISVKKDSNGNFILSVHIADVSHYVEENSKMDERANEQSTSIYLMDKVIPMLPEGISNDLCSLNPNEEKLTLTCEMTIDKSGNVIKNKVFKSTIISKFRLTYEEVDYAFKNNITLRENNDLDKMIKISDELSQILRNKKIENGMIDFSLSEIKIDLDSKGEPTKIYSKTQTKSESIIEDLMVVTNETIGKMFVDNKIPTIFRSHSKPKVENLENFFNISKSLGIMPNISVEKVTSNYLMEMIEKNEESEYSSIFKRYLIQTMEKAIYSNENIGHYALGLNYYLHFTSPIRRYPDLIVHRMIKKYFIENNKIENKELLLNNLEIISKNSSTKEREAMQLEKKLLDIKKTRFLKNEIGNTYPGMIVSFSKNGIFVELDNLIQGMIMIETIGDGELYFDESKMKVLHKNEKKEFKLGQKLEVKIKSLDISRGLIDFDINKIL